MQTIFKSDFEFMQTFLTDLSQELKDCMVSCSAVYGDKSALTRVNVDIADKNGKVFLSIDLFKTCQMVREGVISYSKVLASAITSAENTMSKRDKSFDEHSQEKPAKEFADNEEDDFYGITETVVGKEELPEFHPEDVFVLAMNRKKFQKNSKSSKPLLNLVRFEQLDNGIEKGSTQPRVVSDRLLRTPDLTRFWDLRNAKEESVKDTCVSEHLLAEVFFYLFAKQVATII